MSFFRNHLHSLFPLPNMRWLPKTTHPLRFFRALSSTNTQKITFGQLQKTDNLHDFNALRINTFKATYPHLFSEHTFSNICHQHFSLPQLTKDLLSEHIRFFYAKDGQQFVGYTALQFKKDVAILEKIYVLNAYQHQGLGTKLLRQCCISALEHKRTSMELFVWEHNRSALSFYEKHGFQTSKHAAKSFADQNVQGIVMRADMNTLTTVMKNTTPNLPTL